ncbi:DUF992 domain-containing protein [Acuticoccus kandeliae]|uniref:DUF992 domain-containing protein n=1 Tax=Acuticoccus kandeliae TaxID=2073160 RepID=UPI000D3E26AD
MGAAVGAVLLGSSAIAAEMYHAGTLQCTADGHEAFYLPVSSLDCRYTKLDGGAELYRVSVQEFVNDRHGHTGRGGMAWRVLDATRAHPPGVLAGAFTSHEVRVGGADPQRVLMRGPNTTLILAPDGGMEANLAHAVEGLELAAGGPAPGPVAQGVITNDFADGLAGGPDVWHVVGVQAGHHLNLHARPSVDSAIIHRVGPDATLANRGCRMVGPDRWCLVADRAGGAAAGEAWVAGAYLAEGAAPPVRHQQAAAPAARTAAPQATAPAHRTTAPAPQATAPAVQAQAPSAQGAEGTSRQRVAFDAGTTGTSIEGKISGHGGIDYVVNAKAGQVLAVSMDAAGVGYFNILPPGVDGAAVFIGSRDGDAFEETLDEGGDWIIRTYLMGGDRDEGRTVPFRLKIAVVDGAASSPAAPAAREGDALVPGTEYHATGTVKCTVGGSTEQDCAFGVTRGAKNGDGDVHITQPNGAMRVIFFEDGEAVGADASEADGGAFSVVREEDISIVTVGDETYEIVDAIIFGG